MTREAFRAGLAEIVGADPSELPDELQLSAVLAWDSLAQLSLIALIMEQFDERPDLNKLAACATVRDVLALVEHRFR
jgi:acyl carrier protein